MEDPGHLAFAEAIEGTFAAEESMIGEEEKQPAEIVEALAGVQDVERFLNALEDLPVAELPDGKPYGILPFLAPGEELALLVAFQDGLFGYPQNAGGLLCRDAAAFVLGQFPPAGNA